MYWYYIIATVFEIQQLQYITCVKLSSLFHFDTEHFPEYILPVYFLVPHALNINVIYMVYANEMLFYMDKYLTRDAYNSITMYYNIGYDEIIQNIRKTVSGLNVVRHDTIMFVQL